MRKFLITGGAGFIGSHLSARLLDDGHDVVCLDNYFTGTRENIRDFESHRSFTAVDADVALPMDFDVDAVFHLACPASPVHYQTAPLTTTKTIVAGTTHVLELAKRKRIPVVLASTSEIYGDPDVHPQHEGYWGHVNPVGVRACYNEAKRLAETLAADYRRHEGVDARTVRIFNTYGPRMRPDDGRVVSNFIVQALRGENMTVFGDGTQTRSFCFVDDLVDALVRVVDANDFSGPVNLGNPDEITMRALAEKIRDVVGTHVDIIEKPLPDDDPKRRCPDIGRAIAQLGWRPTTTLDEGIRKTVSHMKASSSLRPLAHVG